MTWPAPVNGSFVADLLLHAFGQKLPLAIGCFWVSQPRPTFSQHGRKASHAFFVRVPCSEATFNVCMIDRSREMTFSRIGCAARTAPRKSCDNSLEYSVQKWTGRLSCVGQKWEDSIHDTHELLKWRRSHRFGRRPARLVIRVRRQMLVHGHISKLSEPHAAPRSASRVVDGKSLGNPHRRRSEREDQDGSAARHAQLLRGRHDPVVGIFRRGDPQRSLAAADWKVTHVGDAACVIAGHRKPLAGTFAFHGRGRLAAPRREPAAGPNVVLTPALRRGRGCTGKKQGRHVRSLVR